ncbi:MAG TPA: 4Fe-4S binding protein [Spirochaetota bacterium]|jgi:ferredoxin|nr:4Fe-4S binding protein [Spirochaetota bacterium]HPA63736.1 4Fe-4S binding protein [Spirochaetota bacterium]HQO22755.1 4Fe-4S binding protein [Spirochaetota bacterium]HQQ24239.1 4Fe-4S binding protein [Spirochaetota bacterium]
MAYKITDKCTSCGACSSECPVEAISEGSSSYQIDASACTGCGLCASVCPMDAIVEA